MSEIGLYTPLNTLKPLAPAIWIADGPLVHMAALGLRAPFPTRMTVVQLADGGLWCHSPIAPDQALFAAIDALGPVRHLVSPNLLHYAHIAAWKRRYPQAIAWASPGVRERAASQHIEVHFDADLDDAPPADWAGTIDQLRFRGSRVLQEIVFLHRASATLIVADLIENFEAAKLPTTMRWIARLGGVIDPDGKAPLDMRLSYLGHKAEARACLARMLAWQPRRVILAHGRCYLDNAAAELARAFRWLD
ncbi:DUF4336 domain-containing protein [Rhodanobacter sp. T12-5]|uniref:DUF4336 domain-containing protein n=1 Tax=Rhodanobacter sp. T12-5 TaxID=2024611 RepID=UPI0011EBD875|nr:DUF4336 domain-containing protein [Rhodanobacter sp. T12-5]KAA0069634.1 DUF4336 domain-containing protein [Rhodanobacter sp. T12-5]